MSKKKHKLSLKPAPASGPAPAAAASPKAERRVSAATPLPEGPEPTARRGGVPVLTLALLALLLFWGDLYVMNNGADIIGKDGSFSAQIYAPYHTYQEVDDKNPKSDADKVFIMGRVVYNAACVACHQPNGQGVAGQFPPLAGSEWVLEEGPNRVIHIVLNGLQGPMEVRGAQYNNVMTPWRDTFSPEQLAAVISFVRNEWGNKASIVTPAEVKAIFDATPGKGGNLKADELKAIPPK